MQILTDYDAHLANIPKDMLNHKSYPDQRLTEAQSAHVEPSISTQIEGSIHKMAGRFPTPQALNPSSLTVATLRLHPRQSYTVSQSRVEQLGVCWVW